MSTALARTVETPIGIYPAGLTVRAVRRQGPNTTVDVSPPGHPARYLTVPTSHLTRRRGQTRDTECGTSGGVRAHNRAQEPQCPKCSEYRADKERASRVRHGSKTMPLPTTVVAAVFVASEGPAADALADILGPATRHALTELHLLEQGYGDTATKEAPRWHQNPPTNASTG